MKKNSAFLQPVRRDLTKKMFLYLFPSWMNRNNWKGHLWGWINDRLKLQTHPFHYTKQNICLYLGQSHFFEIDQHFVQKTNINKPIHN